jgi:hypothetical protein
MTLENPFFLSRTKATHYGDQIQFATHPNRSLSIFDATVLCAWLAFLIDDDKAVSVELDNLRQRPYVKAVAAPHETEAQDLQTERPIETEMYEPVPIDSQTALMQQQQAAEQQRMQQEQAIQERNNEKTIPQIQNQESNTARQGRSPRRTGTP